jgi:hypothetical protein
VEEPKKPKSKNKGKAKTEEVEKSEKKARTWSRKQVTNQTIWHNRERYRYTNTIQEDHHN